MPVADSSVIESPMSVIDVNGERTEMAAGPASGHFLGELGAPVSRLDRALLWASWLADGAGWGVAYATLAIGPALGILSMIRLRLLRRG